MVLTSAGTAKAEEFKFDLQRFGAEDFDLGAADAEGVTGTEGSDVSVAEPEGPVPVFDRESGAWKMVDPEEAKGGHMRQSEFNKRLNEVMPIKQRYEKLEEMREKDPAAFERAMQAALGGSEQAGAGSGQVPPNQNGKDESKEKLDLLYNVVMQSKYDEGKRRISELAGKSVSDDEYKEYLKLAAARNLRTPEEVYEFMEWQRSRTGTSDAPTAVGKSTVPKPTRRGEFSKAELRRLHDDARKLGIAPMLHIANEAKKRGLDS